ncbi:MAG: aldehyde dehydrogenase (NADP(+)) [Chloroflexota bacterium]
MSLEPVLINGKWQQATNPTGSFTATDPTKKEAIPNEYPVSGMDDVEAAVEAAQEAVAELRGVSADTIADFLEEFANNIEANAETLVGWAYAESALPKEPRLNSIELPRTTNQLRQGAAAARSRSWSMATIDTASGIRSMFGPLGGPVLVFGPNNFPFAFNSSAGGDFVAAIAAGNPVIAKANSSHPGTTKVLTELAFDAVQKVGLPKAMVQMLYRLKPADGLKLVSHPHVGATGFTGSKYAGLQLKEAADKAGKPIYLEMSSVNPIVVLPGALTERSESIAGEFFTSCTMGVGQFCTNPGLVVVMEGDASEAFLAQSVERFAGGSHGVLLGSRGPQDISDAIEELKNAGAELVTGGAQADAPGYSFDNTLLRVSGDDFIRNPEALQTEAFGPVSLLVFAKDVGQIQEVISSMEGNLTGCIYSDTAGSDDELYDQVAPLLREKVGRLLNDKMPTGVAVSPAMNHGGPFPATGHPGFTAVGIPASLARFGALHSYDNVRAHRLPAELQDANPTGEMWRLIDGVWSQGDVA